MLLLFKNGVSPTPNRSPAHGPDLGGESNWALSGAGRGGGAGMGFGRGRLDWACLIRNPACGKLALRAQRQEARYDEGYGAQGVGTALQVSANPFAVVGSKKGRLQSRSCENKLSDKSEQKGEYGCGSAGSPEHNPNRRLHYVLKKTTS
jgi:hypothetical protein